MFRVAPILAALVVLGSTTGGVVPRPGVGVSVTGAGGARRNGNRPSFDLTFNGGGYDALNPELCINGTCATPALRCLGEDADADSWNCTGTDAEDFAESVDVGAGFNSEFPTAASADKAVLFNTSGYYRSAGVVNGQVGAGDIVWEWVGTWVDASQAIYSTRNGADDGFEVITHTSDVVRFVLDDASGACTINSTADRVDNTAVHVMFFANRDEASTNGTKIYINGAESGTGVDCSANAGTLTTASSVAATIGARGNNTLPYSGRVAYIALWESAAWHQAGAAGPTEWAAIAKERFARLTGVWPDVHHGPGVPNVMTRASLQRTFKAGEMFALGNGWLDTVGSAYVAEGAITNKLINSDAFGSWTLLDIGDSVDTAGNGDPYGTDVGDGIIGDATDGIHGFSQASAATTAATWTVSCYGKPGNNNWVRLQDTTVSGSCYFDLATPAVGTCAGTTSSFLETCNGTTVPCASGWFRFGFSDTMTAAAQTIVVSSAVADGDDTFAGDGSTINSIFAGCQLELADLPTSYCPSGGTSCDRSANLLQYPLDTGNYGNGNGATGTIEFVVTMPDFDIQTDGTYGQMSDATFGTTQSYLFIDRSTDFARVRFWKGTNDGLVDGTTDIADGNPHAVRVTWALNDLRVYTDGGAAEATDTSVDPAVGIDEFDVGTNNSDAGPLNSPIDRIRLWTTVEVP